MVPLKITLRVARVCVLAVGENKMEHGGSEAGLERADQIQVDLDLAKVHSALAEIALALQQPQTSSPSGAVLLERCPADTNPVSLEAFDPAVHHTRNGVRAFTPGGKVCVVELDNVRSDPYAAGSRAAVQRRLDLQEKLAGHPWGEDILDVVSDEVQEMKMKHEEAEEGRAANAVQSSAQTPAIPVTGATQALVTPAGTVGPQALVTPVVAVGPQALVTPVVAVGPQAPAASGGTPAALSRRMMTPRQATAWDALQRTTRTTVPPALVTPVVPEAPSPSRGVLIEELRQLVPERLRDFMRSYPEPGYPDSHEGDENEEGVAVAVAVRRPSGTDDGEEKEDEDENEEGDDNDGEGERIVHGFNPAPFTPDPDNVHSALPRPPPSATGETKKHRKVRHRSGEHARMGMRIQSSMKKKQAAAAAAVAADADADATVASVTPPGQGLRAARGVKGVLAHYRLMHKPRAQTSRMRQRKGSTEPETDPGTVAEHVRLDVSGGGEGARRFVVERGGASQLIDLAETLMSGGTDVATARLAIVRFVDELVRVSLEGWRQAEDVSSTAIRTFKEVLVFLSLFLAWNRIAASTPSLSPQWYGADDVAALSIPEISLEGVSDEEILEKLRKLAPHTVYTWLVRASGSDFFVKGAGRFGFYDNPNGFWGVLRRVGGRDAMVSMLVSLFAPFNLSVDKTRAVHENAAALVDKLLQEGGGEQVSGEGEEVREKGEEVREKGEEVREKGEQVREKGEHVCDTAVLTDEGVRRATETMSLMVPVNVKSGTVGTISSVVASREWRETRPGTYWGELRSIIAPIAKRDRRMFRGDAECAAEYASMVIADTLGTSRTAFTDMLGKHVVREVLQGGGRRRLCVRRRR